MIGVIAFGVLQALLLAVALSVIDAIRRSARPHDAVLGRVERLDRYADVRFHPSATVLARGAGLPPRRPAVLRQRQLRPVPHPGSDRRGSPAPVYWLVFDAEGLGHVDATGIDFLTDLIEALRKEKITFVFARLKSRTTSTSQRRRPPNHRGRPPLPDRRCGRRHHSRAGLVILGFRVQLSGHMFDHPRRPKVSSKIASAYFQSRRPAARNPATRRDAHRVNDSAAHSEPGNVLHCGSPPVGARRECARQDRPPMMRPLDARAQHQVIQRQNRSPAGSRKTRSVVPGWCACSCGEADDRDFCAVKVVDRSHRRASAGRGPGPGQSGACVTIDLLEADRSRRTPARMSAQSSEDSTGQSSSAQ